MVFLADDVLDNGISQLDTLADRIDITNAEATTYTEATTTFTVGFKDHGAPGSGFGSPVNGDTSGRKVVATPVTDGDVSATDTATHWAVTDVAGVALMAANSLASSQAVTSGNTFTLAAFDIEIPDPT